MRPDAGLLFFEVSMCADCPGFTKTNCPVLRSETSTLPRSTFTFEPVSSTVTLNWVPLTTAARYGVETSKCFTFLFSTSRRISPICWRIMVFPWIAACSGKPMTEFGETKMVSLFRFKSTRPLAPVLILSPFLKIVFLVRATFVGLLVSTHTSPLIF